MEVGLIAVDDDQRITFAIIPQKVHLLELGRPILVVLTERRLVTRRGGAVVGEGGDRLRLGLQGLGIGLCCRLQGSDGLGQAGHSGLKVLGVSYWRCTGCSECRRWGG